MGFVYDVEDVSVGKRYVLKTLTPELLGRRDLARRMEAEARVLARLSHPNVVDVITAGTTQDDQRMPYFVMERLNGQSLRTVLDKKGALDLVLTCRIGIDVLDALEHAHDNGVIHRDVKPDNIFLHRTAVGTTVTKLLDFGVMRLVDSNLDDTRGRFVGTLRYAAPEQILAKEVGPAADIYATALVLYELVAGRGPFDEVDEMVQLANAHVNEAAPPLSRFVETPQAFERLVMSALSKDPDGRPRDAFTFAAELRKLLKIAQRSVEVTSARTAIAPLSSAGTPAMASGSPSAPSSSGAGEDPLSALAAVSSGAAQDGLQAYAKTLAGEDPSTIREGVAQPNFAATMRISDAPPALGSVDRKALTKSFVADAVPRSPTATPSRSTPGCSRPTPWPSSSPKNAPRPPPRAPSSKTRGPSRGSVRPRVAPACSRSRSRRCSASGSSVASHGVSPLRTARYRWPRSPSPSCPPPLRPPCCRPRRQLPRRRCPRSNPRRWAVPRPWPAPSSRLPPHPRNPRPPGRILQRRK